MTSLQDTILIGSPSCVSGAVQNMLLTRRDMPDKSRNILTEAYLQTPHRTISLKEIKLLKYYLVELNKVSVK